MNEQQLAQGLGWFSVGLGLVELLAPEKVSQTIGLSNHKKVLQFAGLRELAAGVGILSQRQPTGWLWSRVAGDVMDLGLLGSGMTARGADRRRLTYATLAVAGVTALDVYCSLKYSNGRQQQRDDGETDGADETQTGRSPRRFPVRKSIIINRPLEEVYGFWRDFENLPRFMNHLISVTETDEQRSHWVAKGPAGSEIEWDAQITEERPNELIAWRSLAGADVRNAGVVRFHPATGGRGTVVRVELRYEPPAGVVGATIAKIFGESPEKQIPVDLLRVKQLLETGEITRTEGQPSGRSKSTSPVYDDWLRT